MSTPSKPQATPISSVADARAYVSEHFTEPEETLAIAESALGGGGVFMAVVTDAVLAAGYFPEGYEQREGYRVYRYSR